MEHFRLALLAQSPERSRRVVALKEVISKLEFSVLVSVLVGCNCVFFLLLNTSSFSNTPVFQHSIIPACILYS